MRFRRADQCSENEIATAARLGVLPIAIGWGAGAELQQPMAIALIGGLITSTILTLVALPALYGMTEGLTRKSLNRGWNGAIGVCRPHPQRREINS